MAGLDILPTLKRFDSDVEEILASSGHVSMYTMAVETQQWNRKDVEGSLFLLKRKGTPRFRMMVLNKLSTENYVEDIHGGLDFEMNPPYLMYTHGNSEIIGVWFYEQEDLIRIEEVLKRIKTMQQVSPAPSPVPAPRAAPAPVPARSAASHIVPQRPPGEDDAFWDKPAAPGAQQAAAARAAAASAAAASTASSPAPAAMATDATNNLANLLRNAQLKQQAQAPAAVPLAAPQGPLPPSFFTQQQGPRQQAPPPVVAATMPSPAQQPHTSASPHAPQRPALAHAAQLKAAEPPPAQMGGALAKLFANAHKAPAPAAAAPTAAAGLQAPVQQAAMAVAAAAPAAASMNGLSDEEKVRRLLARMATNEGLLKMMAAEMRAVGLL